MFKRIFFTFWLFVSATALFPIYGYAAAQTETLRGAWIATVINMDWPSATGLSVSQQKQEFQRILDQLQELEFNAVFVQIRPGADTFWPSKLEPWSVYLTGTQGKDPGYDPLAFMIEEAHKRNMQFHAWFNPYRIQKKDRFALSDNHPAKIHPQWVKTYGDLVYYNPALPEVRQHVVDIIKEVVVNYDIDGVHFDDYFYPYPVQKFFFTLPLFDGKDYKKYGNGLSRADWRRANVNALIRDVHRMIKKTKPSLRFGISPLPVWRDERKDPSGSATPHSQVTNYDNLYADVRLWMRKKWIDYVAPQFYFSTQIPRDQFYVLLNWWQREAYRAPAVTLYIGLAAYKVPSWKNQEELVNQVALLRRRGVAGEIHFHATEITNWFTTKKQIAQAYNIPFPPTKKVVPTQK